MFKIFQGQLTLPISYVGIDGDTVSYSEGAVLDMYHDRSEDGQVYAIGRDLHFTLLPAQYLLVN